MVDRCESLGSTDARRILRQIVDDLDEGNSKDAITNVQIYTHKYAQLNKQVSAEMDAFSPSQKGAANTALQNASKAISAMQEMLKSHGVGFTTPKTKGKGLKRIIMGYGLKIDRTTQGAPEQKSYVGLGKHFIHRHKLMHDGILQIRRKSGTTLNHLPTQKISKPLSIILIKLIGNDNPSFEDMQKLEDNDKSLLNKIIKHSRIDDRLMLPTPERTEEEQEWNRFQVLVGEMQAGNNSPELVKELKGLLLKMAHTNRLPKGQVREILLDLTAMGH